MFLCWLQLGDDVSRDLQQVSFVLLENDGEEDDEAEALAKHLFELYFALHEFASFRRHLKHQYVSLVLSFSCRHNNMKYVTTDQVLCYNHMNYFVSCFKKRLSYFKFNLSD